MIMKKLILMSIFVLFLGFVPSANAGFVTYTDYSSWEAAVGATNVATENFEDTTLLPGLTITEVGDTGVITNGKYKNIVRSNAYEPTYPESYQIFDYAPGTKAVGFWLDLSIGGPGTGINMYINDTNTLVMSVPNTATGGFYGFVNDTAFTGVKFADGGQAGGWQETYYGIDMNLSAAPVPIPGALFLLGPGLLGLVGLRRRILG
jgi:hypothetical protein